MEDRRMSKFDFNEVGKLIGHIGPVLDVKFTTDEAYCISVSSDKCAHLWNPHKRSLILAYRNGHNREITTLDITENKHHFVTAGSDKYASYWDVTTAEVISKFVGHDGSINAVAFTADDRLILTGGNDKTLRLFDTRAGRHAKPVHSVVHASDAITWIHVNAKQDTNLQADLGGASYTFLTGALDGRLRQYDIRKGCVTELFLGRPCLRGDLTKDGAYIVVPCLNNCVYLIDRATGTIFNTLRGELGGMHLLNSSFDSQDSLIASGSAREGIYMWNLDIAHSLSAENDMSASNGRKVIREPKSADWGTVHSVKFLKSNAHSFNFATCHQDGFVHLWSQQSMSAGTRDV